MLVVVVVASLVLVGLLIGVLAWAAFKVSPSAASDYERRRLAWQRFQADREIDGVVHQAFADILAEGRERQRGGRR